MAAAVGKRHRIKSPFERRLAETFKTGGFQHCFYKPWPGRKERVSTVEAIEFSMKIDGGHARN